METSNSILIERSADSISVDGEIDAYTAPGVGAAGGAVLDEHGTVRLDLRRVEFIDSSGLGVLVALTASARDGGGDLVLVAPSRSVVRLLQISGLDGHFTVAAD